MAFCFAHIDYEEENVQPSMETLYNKELAEAFRLILANQTLKELMGNLEMMLPAMNLNERASLLNEGRISMPTQAFEAVLNL